MATIGVSAALLIITVMCMVDGSVKWQPNMKSFSHAIKQASCKPGVEIDLFEHSSGPGVITEQWYTGNNCMTDATIIHIYIDGEAKPSIDFNLHLGHGIGIEAGQERLRQVKDEENIFYMFREKQIDPQIPWGTRRVGHLATGGAIYNTYRIPFQKSIRISFTSASSGSYWYIVRGVENYPIILGDLELPGNARLKLYKTDNVNMQPFQYVHLANVTKSSGALFQVTLATESTNFLYLEACFRAMIDNNNKTQYLSSGTEDFFLSAYYYDKGVFHTDDAGLTRKTLPGTMSAYKFFESDPVLFNSDFKLVWRNGEKADNECFGMTRRKCHRKNDQVYCEDSKDEEVLRKFDRKFYKGGNDGLETTQDVKVTAYVWIYEW